MNCSSTEKEYQWQMYITHSLSQTTSKH